MAQVIPREALDEMTRQIELLSDSMRESLIKKLEMIDFESPESIDVVKDLMQTYCGASADAAAVIAANFYDESRTYAIGEPLGAVAESGREPIATSIAVDGIFNQSKTTEGLISGLASRLDYETKRGAANSTIANGMRDPKKPRFARVPTGNDTCMFCIMLASRGYVYHSAEKAGALDHWHANCRCRVVSSWDSPVAGYDPDYYLYLYEHPEEIKNMQKVEIDTAIDKTLPVYSRLNDNQVSMISDIVSSAPKNQASIYLAYEKHFNRIDIKNGRGFYSPMNMTVTINPEEVFEKPKKGIGNTWFHEFGHNIDNYASSNRVGWFSTEYKSGLFDATLRLETKRRIEDIKERLNAEYKRKIATGDEEAISSAWMKGLLSRDYVKRYESGEITAEQLSKKAKTLPVRYAYRQLSDELNELCKSEGDEYINAVSDIFEGATDGASSDGWGHGKSYWKDKKSLPCEAFAEMYSASIRNGRDLEAIKKYFPESYGIFEDMLEELANREVTTIYGQEVS